MHNATASDQNPSVASNSYSPSIPISIYREVTAELQSTQVQLQELKLQNQQLTQQNQQLRQELENVVQAAIQLHQAINKAQMVGQMRTTPQPTTVTNPFRLEIPTQVMSGSAPTSRVEVAAPILPEPHFVRESNYNFPTPNEQPVTPEVAEPLFTEQSEARLRTLSKSERSELSGMWLIVSIIVIIVFAFGAGYWIVRPLLNQQR